MVEVDRGTDEAEIKQIDFLFMDMTSDFAQLIVQHEKHHIVITPRQPLCSLSILLLKPKYAPTTPQFSNLHPRHPSFQTCTHDTPSFQTRLTPLIRSYHNYCNCVLVSWKY